MIVVNQHFSIIPEIVNRWIKVEPRPGRNKTDSTANLNRHLGWREGVVSVLQLLATKERVQAYGQTDAWIPAVEGETILTWLESIKTGWKNEDWKDVEDEVFYAQINREWEALVITEEIAKDLEQRRRKLILEGKMEPLESDIEWLLEEREQFASLTQPYDRLIKKIKD